MKKKLLCKIFGCELEEISTPRLTPDNRAVLIIEQCSRCKGRNRLEFRHGFIKRSGTYWVDEDQIGLNPFDC